MLFMTVLTSCEWPKVWKCALVIPTQKSGSVGSVSYNRPISILPRLSLALERILFNHIYFKIRQKLVDCQHGFHCRRSRIIQLIAFAGRLCGMKDMNQGAACVYFDFQTHSIECLIISL